MVLLLLVVLLVVGMSLAERAQPRPRLAAKAAQVSVDPTTYDPMAYPYPGRRANGDPWVRSLQDAAVKFWRDRGVNADGVRVTIADDLLSPGAVGLGREAAREVVLDGKVAGMYLANARNQKYTVRGRRRNLRRLAELVAHEVGHVGGVKHTEDGLMSGSSELGRMAPYEMRLLVRDLIPRERPQRRRAPSAR